jgi:Fe-S protein assembly chaperone HscA/FeS assembly protein IscX
VTGTEEAAQEVIVGIDLGTTNSLVAWFGPRGPEVLRDPSGDPIVPSVVTFRGGEVLVGRAAQALAIEHPTDTVWSIKRLMGRAFADLDETSRNALPYAVVAGERGLAKLRVAGREVTPEEVSALILRDLRERAERSLGKQVGKAVITVPAWFDDAQRQATRLAGRLAGLEVVRIVNEPTAAALAYGLDRTKEGAVVVYDLGGGTFDVSVLEIRDGIFRVRATSGDTQLGGDDFDRKLAARLFARQGASFAPDASLLQAARQAAERAKIALSTRDAVQWGVADQRSGVDLDDTITRAEFEALIEPEVARTLACCRRALSDSGLAPGDVKAVVLVGGSTRVPLVRRRVEEHFRRKPYLGLDPDLVVALGASIQADIVRGGARDLLLLDVIPLSLGLETYGGATAKVVMRNTPIPAQAGDTFTTHVPNQTAIDLHVVQGERELVKDCRSLGRFRLRGLPPLPAGMVRVDVRFLVDENGVLTVHAKERFTAIEAAIEVVPSYGLTDAEVARMVDESFRFAREDFEAHQRIDLENECRTMIEATHAVLAAGRHGLDPVALDEIAAAEAGVSTLLGRSAAARELKAAYDRYVAATVPLAGQVMSEVAQSAVAGRTVEQVLESAPTTAAQVMAAMGPVAEPAPAGTGAAVLARVTIRAGAAAGGGAEEACGDLGDGFRAAPAPAGVRMDKNRLDWKDSEEIGIRLHELQPAVDPLTVRFTDLHRQVCALKDFTGDPKKSNEKILEAIQMAWFDEYQAAR